MLKKWFETKLTPDWIAEDLINFDYELMHRRGIKLLLVDIDNTIAKHGSREADAYAFAVVKKLKAEGFKIVILSNAVAGRAQKFADSLELPCRLKAHKPSPKGILEVKAQYQLETQEICMIGDQLFTDIWAAKNAKCNALLVRPRLKQEAWNVRLKRWGERFMIRHFGKIGIFHEMNYLP